MEQQTLAIDSQILNTYQMCARKAKYAFVDRIQPMMKAEALDKGGLLHELLKVHYLSIMKDYKRISELEAFQTSVPTDFEEITKLTTSQLVQKQYDYISTTLDLPMEMCEEVYKTYLEYAQYYANDGWMPIAVEKSFSKVLFETSEPLETSRLVVRNGVLKVIKCFIHVKILYEGIIDWLDTTKIVDHKSSSRRGEPLALSNQFMGYAWAFGVHNVVINKIGFQKTLDAKDKFERYTKSYPADAIEEWKDNAIRDALELYIDMQLNVMEEHFNLTSCDKYGGCIYAGNSVNPGPCQTERGARAWRIQTNYKIGEEWSPAKELEK